MIFVPACPPMNSAKGVRRCLWSFNKLSWRNFSSPSTSVVPEIMVDKKLGDVKKTNDVIDRVKVEVERTAVNNIRMFAIVSVNGVQYRVAPNDLIMVEGYEPFDIGDRITLDKVLMAGSKNFTLIGRPILEKGTVEVVGTVVEKTFSETRPDFQYIPRKSLRILNLYRKPLNVIRINSLNIHPSHIAEAINDVNAKPESHS